MHHCATLEINLSSLKANYQLLKKKHTKQNIASVVKANAYGLGVATISKTLWNEGCRQFFVATVEEGIELRAVLPDAWIGVFHGLFEGEEKEYAQHKLVPVLNDLGQVERFVKQLQVASCKLQAILHIDTGITRLGVCESELKQLPSNLPLQLIISHLACANDPENPKNAQQLDVFKRALEKFPGAKASFANSSGLYLSPNYHFDLARPGCALYGISPANIARGIAPVATLSAPFLQVKTLGHDETVGYGATYNAKKGSRIAIVGMGYADGYFRLLGNMGIACVVGHKVPVIGRVSMDMLALDLSDVPDSLITSTTRAEFINDKQTVNDIAHMAGTIGYEVFTRIGRRVERIYK
jgi:alanine racemase